MERRSFLKTAAAGSFAGFLTQSVALADTVEFPQDGYRYFELSLVHTLIPPEGSDGVARLWVPLPEDAVFQRIRRISFRWVPCDPADVTKMRLTEKKENGDPDVQAVNNYLFGNWEMNWVGFNVGRDFDLFPTPEQTPINNFGYPYAEVDGDPTNYYDPQGFSYDYSSRESNQPNAKKS